MLLKRISDFVLQSQHAIGVAFVLAFIPLIGTLSIVIAAFVTLRRGIFEGTLVLFAATLPVVMEYFLEYFLSPGSDTSVGLSAFDITVLVLVSNVLTWIFAVCLRKYSSWSLLLQVAAICCVLSVALIHFVVPDIQSWWSDKLTAYFTKAMQTLNESGGDYDPSSMLPIKSLIDGIKPFVTGVVVILIVFNALLQVFLARWWQAAVFNPGGLRQEMYDIRMGYVLGAIFVIGLFWGLWGNSWLSDMMPIMYVVFALAGLSLIHSLLARRGTGMFWLVMIYGGMILFPYVIVLIAMVGLIDTWLDFRKRIKKI